MTFLQENPPVKTRDMLIGALLRVPAQAIQRRIIKELNAAGFKGLSMPHMAVLRFPSPICGSGRWPLRIPWPRFPRSA